jgi:hypothetical protein
MYRACVAQGILLERQPNKKQQAGAGAAEDVVGSAMGSLSGSPGIPEAARQNQPFGAYGPRGCWRTMLHLNLSIHK